jgi:phage tail protein X
MVRAYTSIFCNIAEDAYHGRVKMETIISFLDALRGLAAVCHILVEGIVAKLQDSCRRKSPAGWRNAPV